MKFIYLIVIGLCFIQCSNTKQESVSSDSIVAKDIQPDLTTDTSTSGTASTQAPDEPEGDSLAIVIDEAISKLNSDFESNLSEYYTISSNFSGYENGYEATWYFDQAMNVKYCKGSWDAEGNEGRYTYYFKDEDLIASTAEDEGQESSESTITHRGFAPVYGYRKSTGSEQSESLSYLYESSYNSTNTEAKRQLSNLLNLIRNNLDSATVTDEEVSIHLENTVNYGMDFTQKEDHYISKALFNKLIKK